MKTRPKPVDWFKVDRRDAASGERSSAEILIYDAIGGWWGIGASDFVQALNGLDVDEIQLRVNSPGGDVYDAYAIMNALERHAATVTATVDGLAASAATIVINGADKVIMGRGSELMIHEPSMVAIGDPQDLASASKSLDKTADGIAGLYASKAGGTAAEWRGAMRAETWYSAAEAVAAGLADEAAASSDADGPAHAAWDLAVYAYAHGSRSDAPTPYLPAAITAAHMPPARPVETNTPTKGDAIMANLTDGLRERLGITAETDEDGLLAALDEALNERASDKPAAQTEGTVVIDQAALTELQAMAAEGREARQHQVEADRVRAVDSAVSTGRIPPSRRDHWLAQLAADPGAAEVLAGLPANTIPVQAIGKTGGVGESTDDDRLYNTFWPSTEQKGA